METIEQLVNYRHLITLADGTRVLLRPLVAKDRDALIALFTSLPPQETQYFRSNVADPQVVARWATEVNYNRIFPLVAVVGDRLVGNSTLHIGSGYTRHVAEIRIFLEERASFSPDGLTGLEANLRFGGPETMESKIFARLTAWQNWIFQRPNAVGEEGALRRYGTGQKAVFDTRRV